MQIFTPYNLVLAQPTTTIRRAHWARPVQKTSTVLYSLALDVDFLTSPEQVGIAEAVEDPDLARFFQRFFYS